MYFLTTVLPLWKIPPVKTRKPPETSSTFLQMLPSPEASLRLTVSERSDRFALLTAQKVKRSWQLERLPVWPRGHLYPPSCYSCRWMRVPFCSLCIPHTCWALESKWSWIWPSTLRSAAEQWAFLNKQHGAEFYIPFTQCQWSSYMCEIVVWLQGKLLTEILCVSLCFYKRTGSEELIR